jgi:phosphoesterase RecJ-like protein
MRSDSDKADVSAVCRRFGGGGHVRASGCRFQDSLEAVEKQLIAACEEEFSL